MARHRRKLSGPLLDRIDLLVHVQRPSAAALQGARLTTSAQVRERVCAARERQLARLDAGDVTCNAQLTSAQLREHARLDADGEGVLRDAYDSGRLSARGRERVLRVARTLADLGRRDRVAADDVRSAFWLRQDYSLEEAGVA